MEQVYGARVARYRRRRRRRVLAMWFFTLCTVASLLVVAWLAVKLDRLGGTRITTAAPVAMTRASIPAPLLQDGSAGLLYDQLGPPWRQGCPPSLTSGGFSWTAGEAAVAGRVYDPAAGQSVTWYGNACSGPLPAQFQGIGLGSAAAAVLHTIAPLYYGGLRHSLHVVSSTAIRVGGQRAWQILFQVSYSGRHLPWSAERGAVIVVHRGAGQLYYVSVPDNLGTWTYWALVRSLR